MKMCKEVEDIVYDAVQYFFKRESVHFPVHFPPMPVYRIWPQTLSGSIEWIYFNTDYSIA